MTNDTDDTTRSAEQGDRTATNDSVSDDPDEGPISAFGSRRTFLRTAAGVGALALGATGGASAAVAEEVCGDQYGSITINDEFTLLMNQWGQPDAQQCIRLHDDGSYGYEFDATGLDTGAINYPEVFVGTRPWGSTTGVPEFPLRRGDVNELVIDVEADYTHSGGEWDWAEEWWLLEQPPSRETGTHQYEIMLLLDWSSDHDHGAVEAENVWTDQFGNTVDHWTTYNSGGTSATFFIFRIQGGHDGGKIDLAEIVDYLTQNHGVSEDLLISGVELGNEYWGGTTGETTYTNFDVTVNGSTYSSGSGDGSDDGGNGDDGGDGGDTTPPSAPSSLSVTSTTSSSVDVSWSVASDSGGSGLDHYTVSLDGSQNQQVAAGTTSATVSNLSADTSYTIGVAAVDGAGNASATTTVSARTAPSDDGGDDGDQDLLARVNPSTTTASVGERITFRVEDTSGSGQWLTDLQWSFGDGTTATGWWNAHSYDSTGSYTVALTATDNEGDRTTHEVTITVS